MTTVELQAKLTPGEPYKSGAGNDEFYPSGQCDGVIYRLPKKTFVHSNGVLVEFGSKKVGDKTVTPSSLALAKIERRALCYLKASTKEERTTAHGFTHKIGLVSHQGGLVDRLAAHSEALTKDRDAGNIHNHWAACTEIGRGMMDETIFPFLKVVPVEDGIFAILYDPDNDLA